MTSGKNRIKSEFLRRFDLARKKRGFIEDKDVAQAAGISAPSISGWRNTPSFPSKRTIRDLAVALVVSEEWLSCVSDSEPNWEPTVNEDPDHYTVRKEFKAGTLRSAGLPGIHDANDAAIEENVDYFYNELVKPHGIKARPGNIHSLIQYLVEMQERSVKYWHKKHKDD